MAATAEIPPPSHAALSGRSNAVKSLLPFDILRVTLHVFRGWKWIALAAVVGAGGAFAAGRMRLTTKYTAQIQLVRREVATAFQASEMGESFKPRQFNAATVSAMMRGGPLMEETAAALQPPLSAAAFQRQIVIRPEKNTDLITVAWTTERSAAYAAASLNRYAENVVDLTRKLQAQEAKELIAFLSSQMERTEKEAVAVQQDLTAFSKASGLYNADKETESYLKEIGELELKIETARIERETIDYRMTQIQQELAKQDPAAQRLKDEKAKLAELLTQFKAPHPLVVEQQAKVTALENVLASKHQEAADATASFQSTGNTVANSLYLDVISLRGQRESLTRQVESLQAFRDQIKARLDAIPDKNVRQMRLRGKAASLEETRSLLAGRVQEAQLYSERALGYYRLFAPAMPEAVEVSSRRMKLAICAVVGAAVAAGLVAAWRALRAAMNDLILSPSDLRRLTQRPVVASLPDVSTFDPSAMARWRFATWASLVQSVNPQPHGALVVGILSAVDGEGKTTWIRHLGKAALERGLKVLVVTHGDSTGPKEQSVPLERALQNPAQIVEHLRVAAPSALELNADSTWIWTPEALRRWRTALGLWTEETGMALLVELPPAVGVDCLLLAETLPALLWLSDCGRLRREESLGVVETIRKSGLNLVGALFNRIPPIFQKLPDLAKFGLCAAAFAWAPIAWSQNVPVVSTSATSQESPASLREAMAGPQASDARPPVPLAAWQQRLTLGPGDLINLQVFGKKEYTRTEVPVNPDGTITYLQVHGFKAEGKTIDEIREGLELALRAYITNAQVIVTPSAYRSKKYFLMGTVIDRGAYTLDQPMTLLEAAAKARGIATGLLEQNTVEIADMRRAFIVRDGHKLAVDFTRLFYEGDLSQNVQLQPGDYIYFPSNIVNEVYVLGAVDSPGHTAITDNLTAMGAITIRGGFAKSAWKRKVLIVRGSLEGQKREIIEVNAAAILSGQAKDVVLQPRDLVFVHEKPWQRAAEILDLAVKTFIQTGTATWVGGNIGPLIKEPILPGLHSEPDTAVSSGIIKGDR